MNEQEIIELRKEMKALFPDTFVDFLERTAKRFDETNQYEYEHPEARVFRNMAEALKAMKESIID